jgi:dipeptidyl aminopeptidase/acylaminoacyl peptidase
VAPSVDRDLYPRWSPDGRQIAFARFENIDSRMKSSGRWGPLDSPWSLRVSDVAESGFSAAREVFRAPGRPLGSFPRNAQLLRWVEGGRLAFVSEHEDWARLYLADPAAPAAAIALSPTGCEVEDPTVSADGRSLFFAANCGDLERRHVWRATVPARGASASAAEAVTRGTGIETSPVATADGRMVVFHRHDARTPPAPAALALADGATVALVPTTGVDSARFATPVTAVFKAPDGLEIHGALFAPAAADAARRPAIIHVHGGPTAGQDQLGWNPFFQHLVSRGYVVLGLNYRGGAGYGRPFREVLDQGMAGGAEYQDVLAAAEYMRSRPDVDSARIGIFGASYGGYLTMLALARNSDLFAAGVTECGIYDMSANPRGTSRGGDAGRLAKENSAVGSIDKWRSPVLIIHGDDDPGVDFDGQTLALVRALRARKVPFEQLVFPDEGHGSSMWAHAVQVREATADFFDRQLKTPAASQAQRARTPGQLEPAGTADPAVATALAGHLKGQPTAEEYVVGLFKSHDLVFLGEEHFTRPRVLFLQRLIPRLYAAGIRTLAYEMASSEDQELVDRLVNGATYDEGLASEILARWDFYFGYQEYADVFRAAWQVNQGLAPGAPRFRILAIDVRPDFRRLPPGMDVKTYEARGLIVGGDRDLVRNVRMADVLREHVVRKGGKALVYNGAGHSQTRYRRPNRDGGEPRRMSAGYMIHSQIGDRAWSVMILGRDSLGRDAVSDVVKAAMPAGADSVGFDAKASPNGAMTTRAGPDVVKVEDFFDGYVFIDARKPWGAVTPDVRYVTPERVKKAREDGNLPDDPKVTVETVKAQIIDAAAKADAHIKGGR